MPAAMPDCALMPVGDFATDDLQVVPIVGDCLGRIQIENRPAIRRPAIFHEAKHGRGRAQLLTASTCSMGPPGIASKLIVTATNAANSPL